MIRPESSFGERNQFCSRGCGLIQFVLAKEGLGDTIPGVEGVGRRRAVPPGRQNPGPTEMPFGRSRESETGVCSPEREPDRRLDRRVLGEHDRVFDLSGRPIE